MAVSVVSSPPVSPFVLSASYPAIIELSSTSYGAANVTQFRYVAEVTALLDLGVKYTIPASAYVSDGFFDVHELFKLLLGIGANQWNGGATGTVPITQLATALQQDRYVNWSFQVVIKEQYYLSGVFTTNTGPTLQFSAGRGWTDKANSEWHYTNFPEAFPGVYNILRYSGGYPWQVFPIRSRDSGWPSIGTRPYCVIQAVANDTGTIMSTMSFLRDTLGYQGCVYVPMYYAGLTTLPSLKSITFKVYVSTAIGLALNLQDTYKIEKNYEYCGDQNMIMFRDRFFQWSFMSFNKNKYTSINSRPQQAEAVQGRFRYNVKSSDVLTLNTDWLDDNQNELMRDLLISEQTYLVNDADGSVEPVTVVPNSLRLQESEVEGIHQYQMQFRKSLDNFKP